MLDSGRRARSCCSRIKTGVVGTGCTSTSASPLSSAPSHCSPTPGLYTLQAAIAACHSRARSVEDTDWQQIVVLYERLVAATGSPVIELNRAVAVSMASGPAEGLRLVDALAASGTLDRYHLFHSVRGDLLERLGRDGEAADAFARRRARNQRR